MRAFAKKTKTYDYHKFDRIDGRHPIKKVGEDAYVGYKARVKHGGKVVFFNYDLAKEMGLIPRQHSESMNPQLEKKILETFGIVIINEYDEINNIKFPEKDIKKHTYMATRYLQLQHPDKKGIYSGDGRSIWNGQISNKGEVWDISSNGTGATKLSPATQKYNKFFQTGDPSISYGCGCAEVHEGLETLFFSEVLHRNKVPTERILAIIEYDNGLGVNVRAYKNLLRPSHLFNHLKQENFPALEAMTNYYIDTQEKSKQWQAVPKNKAKRYQYFLEKVCDAFAYISALFEDEYIFCWLDWDGDNILMDGGIIDYGSIRQFGLFHYEYRYDDVDRYSTNILEQKLKARYTVQTCAQLIDYLIRGKKKPIGRFKNHSIIKEFEKKFEYYKNRNLLHKIGFQEKTIDQILAKYSKQVKKFRMSFQYFERAKSKRGMVEVGDGISWDAIFCMRDILRELPQLYLVRDKKLSTSEFIDIAKSHYALEEDIVPTSYRSKKVHEFQKQYMALIEKGAQMRKLPVKKMLLEVSMRSSVINRYERITGDSVTLIVNKLTQDRIKLGPDVLFSIVQKFRDYQDFDPKHGKKPKLEEVDKKEKKILKAMMKIVRDHREGI
jgi:uncharacterized protein YdiU (UPF0061 family)